jgi:hypothetical protein
MIHNIRMDESLDKFHTAVTVDYIDTIGRRTSCWLCLPCCTNLIEPKRETILPSVDGDKNGEGSNSNSNVQEKRGE